MLFLEGKKTFPESTKCSVGVEGAIKVTAPDISLHLENIFNTQLSFQDFSAGFTSSVLHWEKPPSCKDRIKPAMKLSPQWSLHLLVRISMQTLLIINVNNIQVHSKMLVAK